MMIEPNQIPGHGSDADPSRRPGVPRERRPEAEPHARAELAQQASDVQVFVHPRPYKTLPAVFGTAQPPKGLSGSVRKLAYGYPDHWTRHWMLLLLSDRIDAMEHRLRRGTGLVAVAGVLAVGGLALGLMRAARPRAKEPAQLPL
jgi:hypothetical protein